MKSNWTGVTKKLFPVTFQIDPVRVFLPPNLMVLLKHVMRKDCLETLILTRHTEGRRDKKK